jgi:hypothetical protein
VRIAKGFCTICGRDRHPIKIATQHNISNTILVPHCIDNTLCTETARRAAAGENVVLKTPDSSEDQYDGDVENSGEGFEDF